MKKMMRVIKKTRNQQKRKIIQLTQRKKGQRKAIKTKKMAVTWKKQMTMSMGKNKLQILIFKKNNIL